MPDGTWLSLAALIISVATTIYQFRIRGAKIKILNAHHVQWVKPCKYGKLSKDIQDKFRPSPFDNAFPGYAPIKIIFGNSGDRAGFVYMHNMEVNVTNFESEYMIRAISDRYILVPSLEIVGIDILLINIPLEFNEIELEVELGMEKGGYYPLGVKWFEKLTHPKLLKVILTPADIERVVPAPQVY
jgi:hypothetical protein